MTSYRLIPLDDTVVFPGMPVTLSVDPGADTRVLLVPRRGGECATAALSPGVRAGVKLGGRRYAVSLMGLHRALPGAAVSDRAGHLTVEVGATADIPPHPSLPPR